MIAKLCASALVMTLVPLGMSRCAVPPSVTNDLTVNGAAISKQLTQHRHDLDIIAWVNVTVYTTPRAFEAYTKLEYKQYRTSKWVIVDEVNYNKSDLPAPDHTANLQPELKTECATGWYRVVGHIIGITSTGDGVNIHAAWPSKKGERFVC